MIEILTHQVKNLLHILLVGFLQGIGLFQAFRASFDNKAAQVYVQIDQLILLEKKVLRY